MTIEEKIDNDTFSDGSF